MQVSALPSPLRAMLGVDNAQYDAIGARYENVNDLPAHAPLFPTVRALLSNVEGLDILDLGCGSGYWTRILASLGAKRVVGVDVSKGMIADARRDTVAQPNVQYHQADCTKPLCDEAGICPAEFDMVFAAWLLNYAANSEQLVSMWTNIHDSLKPGARFVTIVPNLENDLWTPLDPRYGTCFYAVREVNQDRPDAGLLCHLKAFTEPMVEFDCYALSKAIFEQTAETAGMVDLKWHYPIIPKDGYPDGYWDVYEQRPHFLICTATRPG